MQNPLSDQQFSSEQDEPVQKFSRKKHNNQEFIFPLTGDVVEDTNIVIQILNSLKDPNERAKFNQKRIKKYLYFKCKFCSSRLTYRVSSEDQYKLIKINNHHVHKCTRNQQQLQFKRIFEANQKIYCPRQLKNLLKASLGISNRRYHYLLSKLYNKVSFQQIVQKLVVDDWEVFSQYSQQNALIPQLFFGMSPQMKSWAHLYGDSIAYDVTYNLLLNQQSEEKVGVYFFTGFDTNLRILPLAMGFLTRQTTQNFAKIFMTFFQTIRWSGMTIISDEQSAIKSALNLLKEKGIFRGNHIFDCFHYLRTLNKKVHHEADYELFYKIIMSKSKRISQNSLEELKRSRNVNKILLASFQQNIQRYSYSQAQPNFIGLTNCSSRGQKMNDMLKKYIPHEVSFPRFFSSFKKLVNSRKKEINIHFETKRYQQIFKDVGISKVRKCVEKKIFNKFLGNYMMASRIKSAEVQQNKIKSYQIRDHQCECERTKKEGIPCQHLIKYLWQQGQFQYLKYFNRRWLVDRPNSEYRSRPKFSRKNK